MEAFSVAALPKQTVNVPLMVGAALLLTVTVLEAELLHPVKSTTVTVYVPDVETMMDGVLAPLLHW